MTLLMGILFAVWAVAVLYQATSAYLTRAHFKASAPILDTPYKLFPVSVLKPLKGADAGLFENLESFFLLDYPEFELLFSVADAADPAVKVVSTLISRYPRVSARLIIGAENVGTNPKINNLIRSYEMAAHDLVLISDSNVRASPDELKRMVAEMRVDTGMVTSVVTGTDAASWGGGLEALYLNTYYARGMIFAERMGHPCVMGKAMLFRRSVAKRFGGLRNLSRYLAEDYMAGEAMRRLGLKVVIAGKPVRQFIGAYSAEEFWYRHVRWGRIRKAQAPLAFFMELFLGAIVSGALGSVALAWTFSAPAALVFCGHLTFFLVCDLITMSALGASMNGMTPVAWLSRELLFVPQWAYTALGNTVIWRGRPYEVSPGGLLKNTDGKVLA